MTDLGSASRRLLEHRYLRPVRNSARVDTGYAARRRAEKVRHILVTLWHPLSGSAGWERDPASYFDDAA